MFPLSRPRRLTARMLPHPLLQLRPLYQHANPAQSLSATK
jgi:hypothetical protein